MSNKLLIVDTGKMLAGDADKYEVVILRTDPLENELESFTHGHSIDLVKMMMKQSLVTLDVAMNGDCPLKGSEFEDESNLLLGLSILISVSGLQGDAVQDLGALCMARLDAIDILAASGSHVY